jgi:molybdopterin molybdotransferase
MMAIRQAAGLVLAEDLRAPGPVPRRATALRSGYAVASADLVGVSGYAPLLLERPPAWVAAGDPLPPGTDAVLPADAVATGGPVAAVTAEPTPGENVRRPGEDLQAGQVVRGAGRVLRPVDAAVALAAGLQEARVTPFALRLCAERENLPLVEALAACVWSGLAASAAAMEPAAERDAQTTPSASDPDLILAATWRPDGVSPGPPDALAVHTGGLALRGAETALILHSGATPVVVAPPRLDALVPILLCVIDPFAASLTGRGARPVWRRARLTRKIASQVGLTELALLRETMGGLEPVGAGSITVGSLAAAEGFLILPPESEGLAEGTEVEAYEL